MIKLAIIDDAICNQLQVNPGGLGDAEIVYAGRNLSGFLRMDGVRADAVVVELESLGDDPERAAEELIDRCGAELALILYRFAKRDLIHELSSGKTRTLRVPVQLSALRMQLLGLTVREIFRNQPTALDRSRATRRNAS